MDNILLFMNFPGETNQQGTQVDQTTFACVEAAQTTEQQAQVNYAVVPQTQLQPKQPKEKKVFQCQVCEKIFSHTGKCVSKSLLRCSEMAIVSNLVMFLYFCVLISHNTFNH
jgi:hypothetical protein